MTTRMNITLPVPPRSARGPSRTGHARQSLGVPPGFTLLEVMISTLILALALLGIGAVIPVVVRTQKLATDAAQGVAVANGAQAYLNSRADLNRLRDPGSGQPVGWGVWMLEPNWSPVAAAQGGPGPDQDSYLWEEFDTSSSGFGWLNPATGECVLEVATGEPRTVIGVGDRLWPQRRSDGIDPAYVWDFVARRVRVAQGQPDKMQIALFVRRIDPNIRVPTGNVTPNPAPPALPRPWGVYEVVTGHPGLAASALRVPVAVDPNTGLPTLNGVGDYAGLLVLDVRPHDPSKPDRLRMEPSGATQSELDLARQIGQKWVDNLGNVYTVVGLDEMDPSGNTVRIDPSVPAWVPDPNASGVLVENTLREVAFTPQIPAYVTVFTLTPQDPK